jgi:hypothetical protein
VPTPPYPPPRRLHCRLRRCAPLLGHHFFGIETCRNPIATMNLRPSPHLPSPAARRRRLGPQQVTRPCPVHLQRTALSHPPMGPRRPRFSLSSPTTSAKIGAATPLSLRRCSHCTGRCRPYPSSSPPPEPVKSIPAPPSLIFPNCPSSPRPFPYSPCRSPSLPLAGERRLRAAAAPSHRPSCRRAAPIACFAVAHRSSAATAFAVSSHSSSAVWTTTGLGPPPPPRTLAPARGTASPYIPPLLPHSLRGNRRGNCTLPTTPSRLHLSLPSRPELLVASRAYKIHPRTSLSHLPKYPELPASSPGLPTPLLISPSRR